MPPHDDELTAAPTRTQAEGGERTVVAMWPGGSVTKGLPPGARLTVGRASKCDVAIDHPSVSREHAVFHGGPPLALEDLGSTNGTSVNGVRVAARAHHPLSGGDVVTVGAAVLVVYGGLMAPASAAAPASSRMPASVSLREPPVVVDAAMKELHRIAELVAKGTLAVILLGETGVGKEVVAASIHRASPRASAPFVRVACAAGSEALLENDLFGHEPAAPHGGAATTLGLLEAADTGTVFLDEIGELPLSTQAKLLDVIETREVTRIGGGRGRVVDVRFLAATNRDLAEMVKRGAFRQDLYFRLNGLSLTLPPLRKRPSEILPLAQAFLSSACREAGRGALTLSSPAGGWLLAHSWPGNVRELRNVMQRAVALCTGEVVEVAHLSPETALAPHVDAAPPSRGGLRESVKSVASATERQRIAEAMEECGGNQTRAAKLLGISRRTLVSRLTDYGFARPLKGAGVDDE